jgi:3(or 17)beta-hydroxysteroid dehydrogenase
MDRVAGKVAVVTGAANGIGKAAAAALVREGARVLLTDLDETAGKQAADELGERARFLRHDVAREDDWERILAAAWELFGGLHVLVNNAGIGLAKTVEETTLAEWRRVQAVNVEGVFLGCKHALPRLRASGGGSIVNVSSIAGLVGAPNLPAYCASKGAVRLLTKSIALQNAKGPTPVRCNSVHPAWVETAMVHGLASLSGDEAKGLDRMARSLPMGRLGRVEEVAHAIVFLASDESSFMTGSEVVLDGGATAQ